MHRPIFEMLSRVSKRTSLHMPAAQGLSPFENSMHYQMETTELPVTDDLHHPSGAIKEAQHLLAASAEAKHAFFLQGGSTAGIHAMILYACRRGDTIIIPRNVHLSVLNICAVAGVQPVFADAAFTASGYMITTPQAYEKAAANHPRAKAVLVISSDYYGVLADVSAIAKAAHDHDMLLLCDEAHGAYFNWRSDVRNAGTYGADLFVQSAHKTLPAINPAAWVYAMESMDAERLFSVLRIVQTSSPSFVLLQAADDARAWMDAYGREACSRLLTAIHAFHAKVKVLGYTDDRTDIAHDPLRIVLRCPQGGEWTRRKLEAMDIDIEMSDTEHIVCILSLIDGERRLRVLLDALTQIASMRSTAEAMPDLLKSIPDTWPKRSIVLSEAAFAEAVTLLPQDAVGRISAGSVGLYPPGIAWLTAGEIVSQEIADMIDNTPAHRLFGINGGIRCVK